MKGCEDHAMESGVIPGNTVSQLSETFHHDQIYVLKYYSFDF